jgi:hypothetical protein
MKHEPWPELPLELWRDTYATLHMWTQIVGKICLALTPRVNHFWNIAFHVTSRGIATPAMPYGPGRTLNMTFDFVSHELVARCSDGGARSIPLSPAGGSLAPAGGSLAGRSVAGRSVAARSVAMFYRETMTMLQDLDDAGRSPQPHPLRAG